MLKLFLHIAVIIALLTQQLQMVVVCAVFKAQQSYLSKNVCINRNNPKSKCKAHCQLVKRINEQEKQESENRMPFKEQTEFTAHFERPALKSKYFSDARIVWMSHWSKEILSGFCECYYPPPEQVSLSLIFSSFLKNYA